MRVRIGDKVAGHVTAIDEDTYDGAPDSATRNQVGVGRTEQEAVEDLASKLNIEIGLDGNAWYAHYAEFINLQESPCGFGNSPQEAMELLALDAQDP